MSIQETITNTRRGRALTLRIINRLNLYWQRVTRFATVSNPKVFYPYRDLLHTHPFFLRYYQFPPLRYSNQFNAILCHWVSFPPKDKCKNVPYVIEPQDHPLSPTGKLEPGEVLADTQQAIDIYMESSCKRILVESEGQLKLFERYLPESVIEKTQIVRLGAVSKPVYFTKEYTNFKTLIFLCLASDYERKAVDLLIQAWLEFDLRKNCKLILACPNVPNEISDYVINENIEIITEAPLSLAKKNKLLNISHVMIAPLHVDGGANVIEAFEYGLPVISMRSQRSFIRDGNGWEVDVPFYFYDEGYGTDWPTWEHFWKLLDDAKKNNAFDMTVQGFVNVFEEIVKNPERLLNMGKKSYELAQGEFSLETRNQALRVIYSEALQ